MRDRNLTGFEAFLLTGSGNPGRTFAEENFPEWAARLILENKEGLNELALCRWSAIEDISKSSEFQTRFPATLPEAWRGSGRWHAADTGGWFNLALARINRWSDMTPEKRRPFDRIAELHPLWMWHLEAVVSAADRRRFRIGCTEIIIKKHGQVVVPELNWAAPIDGTFVAAPVEVDALERRVDDIRRAFRGAGVEFFFECNTLGHITGSVAFEWIDDPNTEPVVKADPTLNGLGSPLDE